MIKVGIVCGCLPAQSGIQTAELYHQLMAEKIFVQYNARLAVSSTWYTTLSESKAKAEEGIKKENPEILLYHVRPDPYLRLSKLFIRFRDPQNRLHILFNRRADDSVVKQKEYPDGNSRPLKEKSITRKLFRAANYIAGCLFGINKQVIEKEKILLYEMADICKKKKIHLVLIGPPSRPRSSMENYLLFKLEKKLGEVFNDGRFNYVTCFGIKGRNNENLFFEDGIHMNRDGHKRMADLICPVTDIFFSGKISINEHDIY